MMCITWVMQVASAFKIYITYVVTLIKLEKLVQDVVCHFAHGCSCGFYIYCVS